MQLRSTTDGEHVSQILILLRFPFYPHEDMSSALKGSTSFEAPPSPTPEQIEQLRRSNPDPIVIPPSVIEEGTEP